MSRKAVAAVQDALGPWSADQDDEAPVMIVALSGGLDSCVLLHVLRFALAGTARVRAAHFDHGIRPDSGADAAWVRGLCRAWEVELASGDWSGEAPGGTGASEGAARAARYAFLHEVRRAWSPALLLTAHHADDQAETVLFRALRGSGIDGLAGIPMFREPGIIRPLLSLWRHDIEAYARHFGVPWREDASNRDGGYSRNLIRHHLLPLAEEAVPGARRALVRLAGIAGEERQAWERALERVEAGLDLRPEEQEIHPAGTRRSGVSVDRDAFLEMGPELGSRVLRSLVRNRLSAPVPDRAGMDRALEFAASGRSGARIELGRGVELGRALDRLRLLVQAPARHPEAGIDSGAAESPDERTEGAVRIPDPRESELRAGEADASVGGALYLIRWASVERGAVERPLIKPGRRRWRGVASGSAIFNLDSVDFPLSVRGRCPGDRITRAGITRKLKKVLLEARVPAHMRDSLPLVVDSDDRVVWIPGVTDVPAAAVGSGALRITVESVGRGGS